MTEDELRKADEASTDVVRLLPIFLWSFFVELQEQGFSEQQAIHLTTEYMKSAVSVKKEE